MSEPLALKNLHQLRTVLANGSGLVISDSARPGVFHPDPVGCIYVQEGSFVTKVVRNRERNGSYFAVASLERAREDWPKVTRCRSAACAATDAPEGSLESALRAATGSGQMKPRAERPRGVETLMEGWTTTQRIALGEDGDAAVLRTWPAELKPQARAVYGTGVGEAILRLIESSEEWTAEASPHLAFRSSRPEERFYFSCPMSPRQYISSWARSENLAEVGQHQADTIAASLWPWLCENGYATDTPPERRGLERYLDHLERRGMPALLRPGIVLQKDCVETDPEAFQREVGAAVGTLARTLGEPLPNADRVAPA